MLLADFVVVVVVGVVVVESYINTGFKRKGKKSMKIINLID